MSHDKSYITTPIYYVNSTPHIGNSLTTIACDVLARYRRMQGMRSYFLTGTDENALKVSRVADERGIDRQLFVDQLSAEFRKTWNEMHVNYQDFIRTTEPRHKRAVQEVFNRLKAKGDIYLGTYQGWYCVSDETFFAPADVADDHLCPNKECRKPLQWVEENNYFFKLSAYADRLLEQIEANPTWLSPEFRKNEVIAYIKQGLRDQSITRSNPGWGIEVPGEPDKVVYVWFDALINYISAIGWPDNMDEFAKWWPAEHLMGKEIFVRFHATLWPAMLMGLDLPLPDRVFGHGWWTVGGEKGSKSKGNLPHPVELAQRFSEMSGSSLPVAVDAVRFLLCREMQFGLDSEFTEEHFIDTYNSNLANDLGNVLNRTLNMAHKYFEGVVPEGLTLSAELVTLASDIQTQIEAEYDNYRLNEVLVQIWLMVSRLNKYIDESAPWSLAKQGKDVECASALVSVLDGVRRCVIWMAPFMPEAMKVMWAQLGLSGEPCDQLLADASQPGFKTGHQFGSPSPVFPRITPEARTKMSEQDKQTEQPAAEAVVQPEPPKADVVKPAYEPKPQITIDDFAKVELRVGRIIVAERIPKAKKLLKIQVDMGDHQRQVVAGIAASYAPEDLAGKVIIVCTNLQPALLCGVESNGMLLAADFEGKAVLLTPESDAEIGCRIK